VSCYEVCCTKMILFLHHSFFTSQQHQKVCRDIPSRSNTTSFDPNHEYDYNCWAMHTHTIDASEKGTGRGERRIVAKIIE